MVSTEDSDVSWFILIFLCVLFFVSAAESSVVVFILGSLSAVVGAFCFSSLC